MTSTADHRRALGNELDGFSDSKSADEPLGHRRASAGSSSKSTVVSFRLSPEAHAHLSAKVEESGLSPRLWLEKALIENRTQVVARPKPHPDLKALLFFAGKASNNLNQIAHHFNAQSMKGKLSPETCEKALGYLASLERLFVEAVSNARPR